MSVKNSAPIISLAEARQAKEAAAARWERFVELRNRSWEPGSSLEDGLAAGRAYADFLQSFVGPR